ncbi:hypothetical protein CHS0354_012953 [Potamilus streckersoni]|uniref:Uncharacterized protein n=1 Tax=Potamilus streckersoni TaxID=2493646 RepID=A0AAE0SQQ2_9BIVA|nr:hypothetical protein CHS0354_012953 [Potamilus streckersoni]
MESDILVGLLALLCSPFCPCTCLLDNVGDADLEAIRYRLQDEKEKRLLLENDVETMMLKLAELERLCKRERTPTAPVVLFQGLVTRDRTLDEVTLQFFQSHRNDGRILCASRPLICCISARFGSPFSAWLMWGNE